MRRHLFPVFASLALSACAVPGSVNVQSAVPVSKESLLQITTGVSDKAEVMKTFGSPAARTQSGNEEVWTYNSASANVLMLGSAPKPVQATIHFRSEIVSRCVVADPNAPAPEPAPPTSKAKRAAAQLPNDCAKPVVTPKKRG